VQENSSHTFTLRAKLIQTHPRSRSEVSFALKQSFALHRGRVQKNPKGLLRLEA